MLDRIEEKFSGQPGQKRVIKKMLENGIRVADGQFYSGDVHIGFSALARATNTDRRVVTSTAETIKSDRKLREVFGNLRPASSFRMAAPFLKWGVIEIIPEDVHAPGIIADVTRILARETISIRQVIAADPELSDLPRAFFVTETPVPARLLPEIKSCPGVRGVTIY